MVAGSACKKRMNTGHLQLPDSKIEPFPTTMFPILNIHGEIILLSELPPGARNRLYGFPADIQKKYFLDFHQFFCTDAIYSYVCQNNIALNHRSTYLEYMRITFLLF